MASMLGRPGFPIVPAADFIDVGIVRRVVLGLTDAVFRLVVPHGVSNAGIGLEFHTDAQTVFKDRSDKGPIRFEFSFLFNERG